MINVNILWSFFWIISYWILLIAIFILIKKRLRILLEKQVKYTEVYWLELWYKTLIRIVFVCMVFMFIWSSIIILIYTAPPNLNAPEWQNFQENLPERRFR